MAIVLSAIVIKVGITSFLYSQQYQTRQWLVGRLCQLQRRSSTPTATPEVQNVLLIYAGLIGDSVMSTPIIIEARRLWPNAKITLLGQRHNCELLAACPLVNECMQTPAIPFAIQKKRELAQLKQWLRGQNFDVAIIALGDQFASVLAETSIPVRVGVSGHALVPCLTHTYNIGSPRTWGPPERLNALRCLGYEVENVPPRLWVSDIAREAAQNRLQECGLTEGKGYIAIHPFGSTQRQHWPLERVRELAHQLQHLNTIQIVLIGGPETQGQISKSVLTNVIDTTGKLNLQELLAVIEGSTLMISTDSGPFHIAGALSRPLIGLFRACRPEHATRYPQSQVILGQHSACTNQCQWDQCRALPCRQLDNISVEQVLCEVGQKMKEKEQVC